SRYILEPTLNPEAGDNPFSNSGRAPDSRSVAVAKTKDLDGENRSLLLVASGAQGLTVLDVADPMAMTLLASRPEEGLAADVSSIENLALLTFSNQIRFYDLTVPENPVVVDT